MNFNHNQFINKCNKNKKIYKNQKTFLNKQNNKPIKIFLKQEQIFLNKKYNNQYYKKTLIEKKSQKEIFVGIKKYNWGDEGKKVSIYINLESVGTLPKENLDLKSTNNSLCLKIKGLNGKNYVFQVDKLFSNIVPENSSLLQKQDKIVIKLTKKTSNPWSKIEYDEKMNKKPDIKKNEDPQAGLMKMMQKMYEDGDDNMKRTISEAFTKAQQGQMK